MRRLPSTAALVIGLLAMMAVPASSAPPTVGGPKGGSMPLNFTATGPQQHFLAETVGDQPVDPWVSTSCVKPRCHAFPFNLAKPNKTAKSMQVSAQITWASPTSRFWISLMDVTKEPVELGQCFSFYVSAGPSATVEARMPFGRKLAVWVSVEQVLGTSEQVKGSLSAPAKHKPKGSPLTAADRTGLFLAPCQG